MSLRTRCHHSLVVLVHLVLHDLDVIGQRLVRLPELMVSMSKGAIVAKFTLALSLEKFAFLRLVVAIGNVHHFEHEFVRKWLKQKVNY